MWIVTLIPDRIYHFLILYLNLPTHPLNHLFPIPLILTIQHETFYLLYDTMCAPLARDIVSSNLSLTHHSWEIIACATKRSIDLPNKQQTHNTLIHYRTNIHNRP